MNPGAVMTGLGILLSMGMACAQAPATGRVAVSGTAVAASRGEGGDPGGGKSRFDHGVWDALLRANVRDGLVDYVGFLADRARLNTYLDQVSGADIRDWPELELKAFWINAYNAVMIDAVLDAWPVDSVLDIHRLLGLIPTGGVFRERHSVAGMQRSLDDLEHKILRARYADPRIHAALNCASMSCPVLQPWAYDPARLDAQLDAAMSGFVLDPERNRLDHRPPQLSSIFKWYEDDFARESGSPWAYVLRWVPAEQREGLPDDANPGFLSYDWSLNAAAR